MFEAFLRDLLTKFQAPAGEKEDLMQETLSKAQVASLFDVMAADEGLVGKKLMKKLILKSIGISKSDFDTTVFKV